MTLDLGLPPDPDGVSEGFATLADDPRAQARHQGHRRLRPRRARKRAARRSREGAWDFYQKPIDIDALGLIVARAFHVHALEAENRRLADAPRPARVLGGHDHRRARDAQGHAHDRARRRRRRVGDAARRERHRQGTARARAARCEPAHARARSSRSTARRSPRPCSKASCSGTKRAPSPARSRPPRARSSWPQGGTLFLDEIGDVPLPLAGQIAALPAGARDRADRRAQADRGRHSDRLRDASGCRRDGRRGALPRGSLLPPRRDRRAHPLARRTPGRRGAARAAFPHQIRQGDEPPGARGLVARRAAPRSTPGAGRAMSASSRTA